VCVCVRESNQLFQKEKGMNAEEAATGKS
jgi:hypothetical protein